MGAEKGGECRRGKDQPEGGRRKGRKSSNSFVRPSASPSRACQTQLRGLQGCHSHSWQRQTPGYSRLISAYRRPIISRKVPSCIDCLTLPTVGEVSHTLSEPHYTTSYSYCNFPFQPS